jgi:hypothetical protein
MKLPAIVQSGNGTGAHGTFSATSTAVEFVGTTCKNRPLLNLRLVEQQSGQRVEGELNWKPCKLARCKVILFSTTSTDPNDVALSAELKRVVEEMGLDDRNAFNNSCPTSDSDKREKFALIMMQRFRYPPPDVYPFYEPVPAWSWKTQANRSATPERLPSFTKGSEAEKIKALGESEIRSWFGFRTPWRTRSSTVRCRTTP